MKLCEHQKHTKLRYLQLKVFKIQIEGVLNGNLYQITILYEFVCNLQKDIHKEGFKAEWAEFCKATSLHGVRFTTEKLRIRQ